MESRESVESTDMYFTSKEDVERILSQRTSDVTPPPTRVTIRKDVEDLYDEDHYALPDIKGCVTKGRGGPKAPLDDKEPEASSDGMKSKLSPKQKKIASFILFLVVVGGIGGVAVAILTGSISLSIDM